MSQLIIFSGVNSETEVVRQPNSQELKDKISEVCKVATSKNEIYVLGIECMLLKYMDWTKVKFFSDIA
jgi:predicted metal-binding protein